VEEAGGKWKLSILIGRQYVQYSTVNTTKKPVEIARIQLK
jgi:hypothetical protein